MKTSSRLLAEQADRDAEDTMGWDGIKGVGREQTRKRNWRRRGSMREGKERGREERLGDRGGGRAIDIVWSLNGCLLRRV